MCRRQSSGSSSHPKRAERHQILRFFSAPALMVREVHFLFDVLSLSHEIDRPLRMLWRIVVRTRISSD